MPISPAPTNRYAAHGHTWVTDEDAADIDRIVADLRSRPEVLGPHAAGFWAVADTAWSLTNDQAAELYAEDQIQFRGAPAAHNRAYRRLWDAVEVSGRRPYHDGTPGADPTLMADSAAIGWALPESAGFIETVAYAVLVRDLIGDGDFLLLTDAWRSRGLPLPLPIPPRPVARRTWQVLPRYAVAGAVLGALAYLALLVLVLTGVTDRIDLSLAGTAWTVTQLVAGIALADRAGGKIAALIRR